MTAIVLGNLHVFPCFVSERKSKHLQYRNDFNRFPDMDLQPQARSFSFQSSTVTYGGANGAYYTSSKTRRTGSDGVSNPYFEGYSGLGYLSLVLLLMYHLWNR